MSSHKVRRPLQAAAHVIAFSGLFKLPKAQQIDRMPFARESQRPKMAMAVQGSKIRQMCITRSADMFLIRRQYIAATLYAVPNLHLTIDRTGVVSV